MKKAMALAALSSTAVQALEQDEFFRGAQIGMFSGDDINLDDYSCPDPLQSNTMIAPMIAVLQPAYKRSLERVKNKQLFESALDGLATFVRAFSVTLESYDGGNFCQGLLFA